MYQEEAICNREIYKNAEINVLKLSHLKVLTQKYVSTAERAEEINRSELE
jgi:hypothetical protein